MKLITKPFTALLIFSLYSHISVFAQPFTDNIKVTAAENQTGNDVQQAVYANNSGVTDSYKKAMELFEAKYKLAVDRLKEQAASINQYAKANNYSYDYCFLVDMSIPSGKNRLFVYNIKEDSIESSALVAHGFGSNKRDGTDDLIFANTAYSFKTSLGKYKIGNSYNGAYGLAYKLHGLDSTNNKAFERAIVLHADKHVPTTETYPARIFQSAGCPTVAPEVLPLLGSYISKSKKPVLLWIYN